MPEGPQVHRVAHLINSYSDKPFRITRRPKSAEVWEIEDGTKIVKASAVGKNTFIELSDGSVIHNHMYMWGSWSTFIDEHGHRRLHTAFEFNDGSSLAYYGGGRLRRVTPEEAQTIISKIGPDVLRTGIQFLVPLSRARTEEIGTSVMMQTVASGIGNIYKSEGLFRAGISPWTRACDVSESSWQSFFEYLQPKMIADSSADFGPTSTTTIDQQLAGDRFYVYRRRGQPCLYCGDKILKIEQSDRSTYYCPTCQPEE